eukprot:4731174-Prymnesium_polylepis.3
MQTQIAQQTAPYGTAGHASMHARSTAVKLLALCACALSIAGLCSLSQRPRFAAPVTGSQPAPVVGDMEPEERHPVGTDRRGRTSRPRSRSGRSMTSYA